MKVLMWNVKRASISRPGVWEQLEQEDADIVLLQEVTRIPDRMLRHYHGNVHSIHPKYFSGRNARFRTAILTKWAMNKKPFLFSELEWVDRIQKEQSGWVLGCEVVDDTGTRYRVVSTHSPAFFIPDDHQEGMTSQPEYTLPKPSTCPNDRDHFTGLR